MIAAALAPAVPAAAQVAPAVTSGWHITGIFGPRINGQSQISSVDAVSTSDAWLAGVVATETTVPSPLVRHWNGLHWHTIATPAGISTSSAPFLAPVVAASSASNAWVIGSIAASTDYSIALRWNGTRWAKFRFPNWSVINSAAVFSRTSAWGFGQIFVGKPGPFVTHYNGTRWRGMAVPVAPQDASAVSAADIWAVGQTTATFGRSREVFAAMHWNGKSWHAIAFPRLHLPTGVSVNQAAVAAYSSRSAWVLLGLAKGMGVYPGAVLLHWTGQGWRRVKIGYAVSQTVGICQDGHGGVWLSVYGSNFKAALYHERAGHWSRQPAPVKTGETTQLSALSWSSGANFGWAAGEILPGDGSSQGVLLKYFR